MARLALRFRITDPRFKRVQKLFLSRKDAKAEEGRALLREILKDGPLDPRKRSRAWTR